MSHTNEFHIVLPSNVKSSIENTPSSYITQLCENKNLDGNSNEWEVGLVEMTFVDAIKTISKDDYITVFEKVDGNLTNYTEYKIKNILEGIQKEPNRFTNGIPQPITNDLYYVLNLTENDRILKTTDFILDYINTTK